MTTARSKMMKNGLPQHDSFEYIKPAAGYFGDLDLESDDFVVNGWMRDPLPIELNRFALYLNQTLIGQSSPRPALETDEAAQRAGHKLFNFQPVKTIEVPRFSRIDVVGYAGDEPMRRLTTLYRDDLSTVGAKPIVSGTELPGDIEGRTIVLIDDVLYTGRTVRAALDQLIDFGRPRRVQLAVLVDRGNEHRELPIQADYIGKLVPTKKSEIIKVMLTDFDEEEGVVIVERPAAEAAA